ncbi:MAG: 2-C-methyl-D-erythritol 2,4-cyclodiphosphate synthase [Planctomycetes bacterium]|nr:2-C-methyl-D-erythritol 2,4-cyclodiphosphate synthase [Planctomycetota bacterium]
MIGLGFDIHRLVKGRPLLLGGLKIKHTHGLLGHSDGDALLHAICDGILGAAGMGDIGDLFPDTDPRFKGIDSKIFIREILAMLSKRKLKVNSVDTIIFAEAPKLGPIKRKISESVARILKLSNGKVNIKAKTMERLGPIGGKKAIASLALVTIIPTGRSGKKSNKT